MSGRTATYVRRYWRVSAPLVVVLCTAGLLVANPRPKALGLVLPVPEVETAFRAYVFFQPIDCSGNLEFMRVFARPKFRSSIGVTGMLSPSIAEDERVDAKRRFRDLTGSPAVLSSSREVAAALVALGYRTTPFVVVLDEHGQVRLAASVPVSFEAGQNFERQLAELVLQPAAEASAS